jgi:hypothetical protein
MEAQPHTHQNKRIAQADFQSTKKLEAFPNFFLINLAYLINTPTNPYLKKKNHT